nr:MAG TPA: hypothetical protein [Caudoviricetes sp.]
MSPLSGDKMSKITRIAPLFHCIIHFKNNSYCIALKK